MKKDKKIAFEVLSHIIAIVILFLVTIAYFSPLLKGKVLPQSDIQQYLGASHEGSEYYKKEGESSAWLGSMFSGMPAYQVAVFGDSPNFLDYIEAPIKTLDSKSAGPVFAGMLMAYILFCCMGFKPWISIIGAIGYSLGSYNIIILDAGHVTKAWALAYVPLVIAGFVLLFRKKYWLGGVTLALGLALHIKSNHLQITYYLIIACFIVYLAYLLHSILRSEIKSFAKSSGMMAIAVAFAFLCNLSGFYGNYEMSKESTRGKSELTATGDSEKESTGLDKKYVFDWSYGKAETFSLLIPNIHGGASGGTLDKSSNLAKAMIANGYGSEIKSEGIRSYTYWGDQPFTSGPVYFGAVLIFLFVLGMVIIPNRVKWVLFGITLLFIFLAWGRNLEWFNDFFFYHFPMYNKFRAVSTALVIPAITMLIVAIWGLNEFFSSETSKEKLKKALIVATSVVGGIALIFWLMPGIGFNFIAESDASWSAQMPDWYYKALLLDRKEMLSSDAFRSLLFVLVSAIILSLGMRLKNSNKIGVNIAFSLAIAFVILIDLWGVDKRYMNENSFVDKNQTHTKAFKQSVADKFILEDKLPSYRVLNLSSAEGPFKDARTSYYHKSIGGYHAAKLKRYQELIENRLQNETDFIQSIAQKTLQEQIQLANAAQQQGTQFDTNSVPKAIQDSARNALLAITMLNALNTKYIIYHPELPPVINPYAFGNAWFVEKYELVENADAEIAAIKTLEPQSTAVIDKRFESTISGLNIIPDSAASIVMTEYKPNRVKYNSQTVSEQLAVFSEIYYDKGWQAYIDGAPASHMRADWTLRAMRVPAGKHEIEFRFEPKAYNTCRTITTVSSGVLVLLLFGSLILFLMPRKEH